MCKDKTPSTKDGRVTAWLGPNTFQVQSGGQSHIVTDRTGRAQPGRDVTLVRVGASWRVA